jgi:hypothetical protein
MLYILYQFSLILSANAEVSELMDMDCNNGAMCHTMDQLMLLGIFFQVLIHVAYFIFKK